MIATVAYAIPIDVGHYGPAYAVHAPVIHAPLIHAPVHKVVAEPVVRSYQIMQTSITLHYLSGLSEILLQLWYKRSSHR